jgi:phosphoglycerol transferase MdoB-like AlkP superfamily enzyme
MNVFIIGIVVRVYLDKGLYSLDTLFTKTHAPMLTINKTGLFAMEGIDVYRYAFGFEEQLTYFDDDEDEVVIEPKVEYNITNINFDKLISKTTDSTLKKMHKYFKSVQPTEKNDFTGVFKGKNIIFITAEGFDKIALDKKLTPTLYKMANTGFVFNNYYQPLYPVSTSDGEYMNLTGLIPKEGVWSFYRSSNNNMKMSYPNVFKKNGYTTYGFHNHTYKYYDRHLSHPNIGLKYIGCGNGLEKKMNCDLWPNSDIDMIKVTTDYYFKKQPFATYYTTVSGHLEYNFGGNNMARKNREAVQDMKTSEAVKAYMATQIELDKAMEVLLKRLEKAKLLDNTLIVIAPDHYPYGLSKSQLNERSKTDRSDKFENYHTTLIMYNPNLRQREINTVVSSLDIIPTLYNLFGLEYDSRLLMGRDIFSKEEHIVILSDRSWITDKGTYNSVTGKFTPFNKKEKVSQSYIKKINSTVNKKVSMSTLILDKDYYKAVGLK